MYEVEWKEPRKEICSKKAARWISVCYRSVWKCRHKEHEQGSHQSQLRSRDERKEGLVSHTMNFPRFVGKHAPLIDQQTPRLNLFLLFII